MISIKQIRHFSFARSFPLAHLCATLMWQLAPMYIIMRAVSSIIESSATILIRYMDNAPRQGDTAEAFIERQTTSLNYFILFAIFKTAYGAMAFYVTNTLESNAAKAVSGRFLTDQFARYDTADHRSKQLKNAFEFNLVVDPVKQGIDGVIAWGLNDVIEIVTNMLSCSVITYDHPWIGVGIATYGICVIAYASIAQADVIRRDTELKRAIRHNAVSTNVALGQFQSGIVQLPQMTSMKLTNLDLQHRRFLEFMGYRTRVFAMSRAPIWVLAVFDHRLAMLNVVMQLVMSIDHICRFMVQYQRMESDYTTLNEMWADMTFKTMPTQVDEPADLHITEATVLGRDRDVILTVHTPINLIRPGFYIAAGPSGGGKTTFINALMGNYGGLVLAGDSRHQPDNHHTHFAVLDQHIKSLLKLENITLREALDGATNAVIDDIAAVVELTDWIARHGRDTIIRDTMNKGGESSRLALALVLLRATGKPYLVLDEFEQGIDPACAYRILGRIRSRFSTSMLIVITHLETVVQRFQDQITGVIHVNRGVARLLTVDEALFDVV